MLTITSKSGIIFEGYFDPEQIEELLRVARLINNSKGVYESVIEKVCTYYNLEKPDLYRKCRIPKVVKARAIIYYHLVKYHGYTRQRAGDLFDQSHATVIHAIKGTKLQYMLGYKAIFDND